MKQGMTIRRAKNQNEAGKWKEVKTRRRVKRLNKEERGKGGEEEIAMIAVALSYPVIRTTYMSVRQMADA